MSKNIKTIKKIIKVLPSSEANLKRLYHLVNAPKAPRIAAFGKYNHGKSTLLNALIGESVFKAADKRETLENKEHEKSGVVWLDTPGLDADVHGEDDKKARKAAFEVADVLFLVHNVATGELDKYEMDVYRQLMRQDTNYRSKLVLVLTQVDQITEENLSLVVGKITKQIPNLKIFPVSAVRYIRGNNDGEPVFIEASGIRGLQHYIAALIDMVADLRNKEVKRLRSKVRVELSEKIQAEEMALDSVKHHLKKQEQAMRADFTRLQKKLLDRAELMGIN